MHDPLWWTSLTFLQAKPKKNVETDIVGDKVGRIHLGKQNLGELQTRKMKGLKRGRDTEGEEEAEAEDLSMEVAEKADTARHKRTKPVG